jgi:hypothetical protein
MSFDFLDDVFLLNLPLKAAQGVFEGLSLLQSDLCQMNYTPKLVLMGQIFIARFRTQVKRFWHFGSKHQPQSELKLTWSISAIRFHEVCWNLIDGWEVSSSNEFTGLKELGSVAYQAVGCELESFIVPI